MNLGDKDFADGRCLEMLKLSPKTHEDCAVLPVLLLPHDLPEAVGVADGREPFSGLLEYQLEQRDLIDFFKTLDYTYMGLLLTQELIFSQTSESVEEPAL